MKKLCLVSLVMASVAICPNKAWANQEADIAELQRKIAEQDAVIQNQSATIHEQNVINQDQQQTIQLLLKRMADIEKKVEAKPPQTAPAIQPAGRVNLDGEQLPALPSAEGEKQFPMLDWSGYVDLGYVDAQGEGTTASASTQINSRGDSPSSSGLDGDPSFLVNEVNLQLNAHVSEKADVVVSFDVVPRNLGISSSNGSATTDDVELDLAYVVYAPSLKANAISDNLLSDLRLSAGKIESPMGIEYRQNKSPDRVNISRSHQSVYTTGYPVGIRARGNISQEKLREFRNSILTYNLVIANTDPFLSRIVDGDIDTNSDVSFMGRFSYGLDTLGGFFESGVSLSHGARIGQTDNSVDTDSIMVDARMERGPFSIRSEWDYADEDRPVGGSAVIFRGLWVESFYEFGRPDWLPQWMPLTSLTPYYRFDTRDFVSTPLTGSNTIVDVERHTFALRYTPRSGSILKLEYQLNEEKNGPKVNDNQFLVSFVQQF